MILKTKNTGENLQNMLEKWKTMVYNLRDFHFWSSSKHSTFLISESQGMTPKISLFQSKLVVKVGKS